VSQMTTLMILKKISKILHMDSCLQNEEEDGFFFLRSCVTNKDFMRREFVLKTFVLNVMCCAC